jgi:hypothetical protein
MAGWVPLSPMRPQVGVAGQNLTLAATSAQSAAFNAQTYAVRISSTGNCHVAVGTNPVATATDMLVKATDSPWLVKVAPGEKIAVIQDAVGDAGKILNISEQTF